MSAFPRFLPASRRFYSSFFSSKSGGGRCFNAAKAPKSAVIAAAARQTPAKSSPPTSSSKASDSSSNSQDGDVSAHQSGETSPGAVDAQSGNSSQPTPAHSSPPSGTKAGESANTSSPSHRDSQERGTPFLSNEGAITASWFLPTHPLVNPKDFKLHQFFSLHRPLLLLSNPSSILHPAPPSNPLFPVTEESSDGPLFTSDASGLPPPPHNILSPAYNSASAANAYYEIPETSSDADAETARQLARALAMNKAGGIVEWEGALRSLGLDVEMEPERAEMREQMEKEWEDVLMDSTKRKRRKKMRRHKLKKRRRLTRATRLKIGR